MTETSERRTNPNRGPAAGETLLVLGVTGSFGGAVAREWAGRGRPVRALVRDLATARTKIGRLGGIELVQGDVQDRTTMIAAATGTTAIVHGVNYPYPHWRPHMVTATENVVAAAKATGATVLFPGNVYGLGRPGADGRPFREDMASRPVSRKGAIRVEMEAALRVAAARGSMRAIVVRAGDYFGPTLRNELVDPIFKAALAGRAMQALGSLDISHQWVYLPDLARVSVDLLEHRAALSPFEVIHVGGQVADPARAFHERVAAAAGTRSRPRRVPWSALRLIGLFRSVVRELL